VRWHILELLVYHGAPALSYLRMGEKVKEKTTRNQALRTINTSKEQVATLQHQLM